jgi:hypothetical protein
LRFLEGERTFQRTIRVGIAGVSSDATTGTAVVPQVQQRLVRHAERPEGVLGVFGRKKAAVKAWHRLLVDGQKPRAIITLQRS